jgi:hypothetical protein
LSHKVHELTKENTRLKTELSKLRQLIQKTTGFLPDASNLQIGGSSGPSTTTTTTVVLFIMLFSFGLFVTNFSGVKTPQQFGSSLMVPSRILELPSSHHVAYTGTGGRSLKAQESYIPSQSTQEYSTPAQEVLQFANYERSENPRVINFDSCCDNTVAGDNSSNNDDNQRNFDRRVTKIIVADEENPSRSFGGKPSSAATPQVFAAVAEAEPPRIQADLNTPHASKNATLMTFLNEPNPSNLSKILEFDMDVVPHAEPHQFLEEIKPRRNTAYFTVHGIEQVFPVGADQMFDSELPLQLSLLITPEALSILPANKKYAKTPFLEIITEVQQVNIAKNVDIFDALPILA